MKFISCLALGVALLPLPLLAMEDGRVAAAISLAATQQNATPTSPWISAMRISGNNSATINLADGKRYMQRPGQVSSYGLEALYDVSRFYKPNSTRLNVVMHWAGRKAGEIISVGVDSGYRAEKIAIQPALFLGYARSFRIHQETHLTFAAGGWVGGQITHKACRDSFDRKYYCRDLTAWSDFRPQQPALQRYLQIVYTREF